jgi:D-arabinitol 2-dehydrogenase
MVVQTWKQSDPGHDVTGAGHGRHNKRTLASLSMEGKICVITGAGRGLGNMVARTFVESGADSVALIDLKQEDADSAAKDLTDWFGVYLCNDCNCADRRTVKHGEAQPGEIHAVGYGCDVADETSVKDTFAKIEKDFGGRIDVSEHPITLKHES